MNVFEEDTNDSVTQRFFEKIFNDERMEHWKQNMNLWGDGSAFRQEACNAMAR